MVKNYRKKHYRSLPTCDDLCSIEEETDEETMK
jgi:hypothetical protein